MSIIWLRCRAELRAKWRNTVVLILLVGIGGGIGVTALAGARRTDEAVSQFVTYSLPDDGGFLSGAPRHLQLLPGFLPTRGPFPPSRSELWTSPKWSPTSARPTYT